MHLGIVNKQEGVLMYIFKGVTLKNQRVLDWLYDYVDNHLYLVLCD